MHDKTPVADPGLRLDILSLKKASALLRAVNHPLRQQMLRLLHERECCVTELYEQLKLEQSVASQHLAILRQAGVVLTRRKGRQIIYGVAYDRLNELQRLAGALLRNGRQ